MKVCLGFLRSHRSPIAVALALAIGASGAGIAAAKEMKLALRGDQEVPAVQSMGSGSGSITIGDDMSVSGSVMTTGIVGTKAHIHDGAAGKNGPVIIELTKNGDSWAVPAGAKLTAQQFKDFQAGNLYVNVHTAANPKGEMRAQLTP
jgi:hypothetical protein